MKPRILVSREVFDETLAMLAEHFEVESNQTDVRHSTDALAALLADKDGAVISTSDRIDASVLARAPKLKVVSNVGVGYNNLDIAACTAAGVMATNTPGVLTDSVADYTFGLVIATCRRMTEGEHMLRSGEWKGSFLKQMLGADVHGATLGIMGMGRIGQTVARRALGFDMKVIYNNRTRLDAATEAACNASYRGKEDLLREADIVVLLMPYTPDTHHMIGAAELALMKPTAVLVNVARGGIVDDAALAVALREGRADRRAGVAPHPRSRPRRLRERAELQPGPARPDERRAVAAHRVRVGAHASRDGEHGRAQLHRGAHDRQSAEPAQSGIEGTRARLMPRRPRAPDAIADVGCTRRR